MGMNISASFPLGGERAGGGAVMGILPSSSVGGVERGGVALNPNNRPGPGVERCFLMSASSARVGRWGI